MSKRSSRRTVKSICYRELDPDDSKDVLAMHLGGTDSDSDFEEQYKKEYIRSEGALPGSSRDKKNKKMDIGEIIFNEKSSSDNESSGSASDNYDDKSITDTRMCQTKTSKTHTKDTSTSTHATASKRLSMLKDCGKVLKNSTALKRHAIAEGTRNLQSIESSLRLASDELNLSESSSEDETHCHITKIKRVKKLSKEYNVITTDNKNINHDMKSINLHHSSQVPQQDSEMAIQLESLAMSYNSVAQEAESSRQAGQDRTSQLRDIKNQKSDINKLLSLGEGVSIEDANAICENKRSSLLGVDLENNSIEITLEDTDSISGKLKKKIDPHTLLMNEINRMERALRVVLHKCSFLGLVSHLRYMNSYLGAPGIINEDHKQLLLAVGLSIVPAAHVTVPEKLNMVRLSTFVSWFRDAFPVVNDLSINNGRGSVCSGVGKLFEESPKIILQRSLSNYVCERKEHLVFIFVLAARSLGWNTRLTMNLDTPSLKVNKKSEQSTDGIREPDSKSGSCNIELPIPVKNIQHNVKSSNKSSKPAKSNKNQNDYATKSHKIPQLDGFNDFKESSSSDTDKKTLKKSESVTKSTKLEKSNNEPDESYKNKCRSVAATIKQIRQRRKMENTKNVQRDTNQKEAIDKHHSKTKKNDGIAKDKKLSTKALSEAATRRVSAAGASNTYSKQLHSDSDSDESNNYYSEKEKSSESSSSSKKRPGKSVPDRSSNKPSSHKTLESTYTRNKPCQYWAEVYIDPKWVTVDVINGRVDCPAQIENNLLGRMNKGKNRMIRATSDNILYVIAANIDGSLNDVTKRYTSDKYMTVTRKLRAPLEEWIKKTIKPYKAIESSKQGKLETIELRYLEKALANAPMPKTLGAFKNHPFYALKKDLHKNQAIYPKDAPTLGFIQGQGIYARECVQELQSRSGWLKQGLVVKIGEEPYKIITAKSKLDKMSGEKNSNQPLETFGKWQTEKYIPPAAKDGKVPRNEYGNVELFKPWMLPKGTIHVPIQGLNRIARKLNIDCAPAMVGWEFANGAMRPVYDGFVICEEANDYIMDAWNQEMDEQMKKEALKREKRAIDNWRKLVRGMLLYKKIAKKYSKK